MINYEKISIKFVTKVTPIKPIPKVIIKITPIQWYLATFGINLIIWIPGTTYWIKTVITFVKVIYNWKIELFIDEAKNATETPITPMNPKVLVDNFFDLLTTDKIDLWTG